MRKMSKRKIIVYLAICLTTCVLSWAGTHWVFEYAESKLFGWHFVEVSDIAGVAGVKRLDPNGSGFEIIKSPNEPHKMIINWNTGIDIPSGKCRLKHLGVSNLQVLAQVGEGGTYRAIIDTGNPGNSFVTDTVVTTEGLAIYPFDCANENCGHNKKKEGGFCDVGTLKIGEMSFVNPFCTYRLCHYEKWAFGKAVKTEREINIGMGLLKEFSYILIDNIKQEVEFARDVSFAAEPNENWSKYPAVIEGGKTRGWRVMVDIDIGSKSRKVMFDTGSGSGLTFAASFWKQMRSEFEVVESKRGRAKMLHGFEACEFVTVEQVSIGGRIIKQARIEVLGDDTPFGTDFFLMGMGFFREKVIVLDFEHELFWVKE